jgi:2,4-dienoyl-CoA reductase-like NADH-dependent reductase (Old Yellow Enzyme family)
MTPFTPFTLPNGQTLKNRLVLAPMTTYSSFEDGHIKPTELAFLKNRAEDGFGMVMTAACYVHPSGKAFDGQWACSDDRFLPSLESAANAIHQGGSFAVLQIHHGGRQCPGRLCGGTPLSASAIPNDRPNAETPRAMTIGEIQEVILSFAKAALRAKEAGFDGVEIHGANTYLLQQFVSPHSNRREDEYGRDRLLFPRQVVDEVLAMVGPNFPVGYRFSPEELETPGIRWDDTSSLIDMLMSFPLSWLHVSLRDYIVASLNGDFDEPVLAKVRRQIGNRVPVISVGSVNTLADAEGALKDSDLVAVARAAITDPEYVRKLLTGQSPNLTFPRENAEEKLTLPVGLADKIRSTPGWFPMENFDS